MENLKIRTFFEAKKSIESLRNEYDKHTSKVR